MVRTVAFDSFSDDAIFSKSPFTKVISALSMAISAPWQSQYQLAKEQGNH